MLVERSFFLRGLAAATYFPRFARRATDWARFEETDSDGAVAQLGERLNGIQEVRGSTPLGSTNLRWVRNLTRVTLAHGADASHTRVGSD